MARSLVLALAIASWGTASPALASPSTTVAQAPAPEASSGACTRRRAEAELRAKTPGRAPTRGMIDAEFQRCFQARLAACQLALDADADEGFACWKQDPWPEVPVGIPPEDVTGTGVCLTELKAVISDLRKCRTKKPAERDACVTPYIGYAPKCPLLNADRMWRAFPGRADVERVAKADAERRAALDAKAAKEKAEREAKEAKQKAAEEAKQKAEEAKRAAEEARIAKETERCFGRTTLDFAERLKAQPGPRSVPGCKYQVTGRVVSRNNVFVQLVDSSGGIVFLLRTREPFADGELVAERTATFDSIEEAELADGSKRAFAVFKLEPAPRPKK